MYSTNTEKFRALQMRAKELERKKECFDRELDRIYEELGVSPEELEEYLSDRTNFTDDEWEVIEKERRLLDMQPDPLSPDLLPKKQKPEVIPNHALFVR